MVQREIRLVARRPLSSSVAALRFEVLDGQPFEFEPGQWVNLNLPGRDAQGRRAYSIAGASNTVGGAWLEFAVTHVRGGCLSPALFGLNVGQNACLEGPFGFFSRQGVQRSESALFIGTGSGIAPLRAMILDALSDKTVCDVPMTLLFGCRTEEDILYRSEFVRLDDEHTNFDLAVTLSRPAGDWHGRIGYVQSHLQHSLAERDYAHVYICGLSSMVREVRAVLKGHGFGRGSIHSERFD